MTTDDEKKTPLEQFKSLRSLREHISCRKLLADRMEVRIRLEDEKRSSTEDRSLPEWLMREAMDYSACCEVGNAVKDVVLRYLDNRLRELAEDAQREAEAIVSLDKERYQS